MDPLFAFSVTTVAAALAAVSAYWIGKRSGSRTRLYLSRAIADRAFVVLTIIYVVIFTSLSILQFLSLTIDGFDLGFFDQAIWNSLHGRILALSVVPDDPTVLGQHFSPLLLSLVPLYTIWSSPHVLLVVQTLAIAASAFPIYWFARERLGNALGLLIASAYYLFPALEFVNLAEFHEIVFVILLFSYALYFLLKEQDRPFLVCLALSLLVKEEIAFGLVAFGAFVFLLRKRRWLGLGMAVFGVTLGVLLLETVLPFLRGTDFGTGSYFLGSGLAGGHGRYDYLGTNLSEITHTLLFNPNVVLQHVLIADKLVYLLGLLVPLAFTPLVGIEVLLLAAPTLALSLLSSFPTQYSIDSQYPGPVIPILFFALVVGIERVARWSGSGRQRLVERALGAAVLVGSLCSYAFLSPGPLAAHFAPNRYAITPHAAVGLDLVRGLPTDRVLVTQQGLLPHLTQRRLVYQYPFVLDYRQVDYLFFDKNSKWGPLWAEGWKSWFDSGYFATIKEQDGYVIAERRGPDHPSHIQFGDALDLLGYSENLTQTLRGGQAWQPIVEWESVRPMAERYAVSVQLVDSQGHVWAQQDGEPQNGFGRTDRWEVGRTMGDQYLLKLPSTMPPGDYQMTIGVHEGEERPLEARDEMGRSLGERPVLTAVHVEKDHTSLTASQLPIEQPLFVDMGEMRFVGYVPPRQIIKPGELLQVGLYWRAREKPRGDYAVAVQLRDAAGNVVFEQSSRPANGAYPTTQWDAGEVLLDWHDFNLRNDIAPGEYQIYAVLKDAVGGRVLGETKVSDLSVVEQ